MLKVSRLQQRYWVTPQYTDEFVKQSNEITENIVSAVRINNQLTVNAINAAAENFRTQYSRIFR